MYQSLEFKCHEFTNSNDWSELNIQGKLILTQVLFVSVKEVIKKSRTRYRFLFTHLVVGITKTDGCSFL